MENIRRDFHRASRYIPDSKIQEFVTRITASSDVSFDSITWDWELPAIPAIDVQSDIILLCTSRITPTDADFVHFHASTYLEYLKRFQWADFIMEILDILSRTELDSAHGGFSIYAMRDPSVWITCSLNNLLINFKDKNTCLKILDLVEMLDWFCKSLYRPTSEDAHVVSSASYHWNDDVIAPGITQGPEEIFKIQPRRLRLSVKRRKFTLPELRHSCWLSFFDSCVIVESSSITHYGFGEGLEMTFDLMISLAASEFCLKINNTSVFLGYQTILYPVGIVGNCAQFHLITTTHGQINPYTLDLKNIILVEDTSQFKTMRCFVGWCEDARITLGTRGLAAPIKYTGGQEHPASLTSDGYAVLGQFGVSAPLSAIVGVQKNFKYNIHRIRFTPPKNYLELLQDTSQQPVVLYDAKQRRCWLVPKLSLLLHMAQKYALCSATGTIPYAEPHMDARDLISILKHAGQINILEGQADPLQLQTLLLALNIRMLSTTKALRKSGHGHLYGFEFMDVVRNPDQGSCMKQLDILPKRKAWLELVNAVGTVIVCSDLGEVISAEGSSARKCKACNRVPEKKDYLTATIPCLLRLLEQRGVDLSVGSGCIKFSDNAFWYLKTSPFFECTHEENSRETCWDRPGLIQWLVRRGVFDWMFSLLPFTLRPVQSQPGQLLLTKGAVVFG